MNCFYGNTTMTISEFISRRETILTSGNIKGIMQYVFTGPQASFWCLLLFRLCLFEDHLSKK